jgi:hypothetical protein
VISARSRESAPKMPIPSSDVMHATVSHQVRDVFCNGVVGCMADALQVTARDKVQTLVINSTASMIASARTLKSM